MAQVLSTVNDAVNYLNTLYNASSTPPSSGEEDYTVWIALFNIATNLWESEEGILWNELYVKLADAADGTKTTAASTFSYSVPSDFRFPASGYVWLGTATSKTPIKVIKQTEVQLHENDSTNWCYFLLDTSPTLEFNPNMQITASQTISYNYYKYATKLTGSSSTFEMSDPMFAVWYALSELKKEEGDPNASTIATQKLEGMKVKNMMPTWFMEDPISNKTTEGFGR